MLKKTIWLVHVLLLFGVSSAADGTFEQLRAAVDHGQVLQGIRYDLAGKTLVLSDNQKILGIKNTVIYSSFYPDYHWQFITIKPNSLSEPVKVINIVSKNPHTTVKLLPKDLQKFKAGESVVLEGKYSNSTTQTLFTKIKTVMIDSAIVSLEDSLLFTLEAPLLLKKVADVNCAISNLSFETNSDQQQTVITMSDYCRNVKVTHCVFVTKKNTNKNIGIFSRFSSVTIEQCSLQGFGLYAIRLENNGYSSVSECSIQNSNHALTLIRVHNCTIKNNRVSQGSNLAHGRSIFLSADDDDNHLVGDECYGNTIEDNVIDNVVNGVPGSGLGGIHLHRKCNFNVIRGNSSMHNGMGIYLETNNDFNRIVKNKCSFNNLDSASGNVYGIGIELDYENDNNVIDSNECSYNNGLVANASGDQDWYGMTGMGIEVRNGYGSGHDNMNNVITRNTCSNNGSVGIKAAGTGSKIIGNLLVDNGQNVFYTSRNSVVLSGRDITFSDNSIDGGSFDKKNRPYNFRNIDVAGDNISIVKNTIKTGCYSDTSLLVNQKSHGITLRDNLIVDCGKKNK